MTVVQALAFRGPRRRRASDVIHIGLVNNMPDTALRATELQFARLLKDAAGMFDVHLHLFSFPEIERSELALSRMEGTYASTDVLETMAIDALIVTGAEPREADLRAEPYWKSFVRLVDRAQTHTISTMFSCLAAHAAVEHLHGVKRHALPEKLSGVFDCEMAGNHPLTLNLQADFAVPHSRFNDVREKDLAARGYQILSRLKAGGANIFVRQEKSLLVFLQGHPEYDEVTLGREYLRDVGRYLDGEREERPNMPHNYFDPMTQKALADLGLGVRNPAQLQRFSDIVGRAFSMRIWRRDTIKLFENWLALVAAQKIRLRLEAAKSVPLHQLRRSA